MNEPTETLLELHVPLTPTPGVPEEEYQFPWIDELDEAIEQLADDGVLELHDDAEELDGHYVFSLGGASEQRLIAAAERLAALDAVPAGAFAMVNGERIELAGL